VEIRIQNVETQPKQYGAVISEMSTKTAQNVLKRVNVLVEEKWKDFLQTRKELIIISDRKKLMRFNQAKTEPSQTIRPSFP
jgi:hypothetical protein